jgi:hypothetical protein
VDVLFHLRVYPRKAIAIPEEYNMSFVNGGGESDGKAAERAAFRHEYLRQFRFLPIEQQEKINRDPMCREADLLFESVEKECERKRNSN